MHKSLPHSQETEMAVLGCLFASHRDEVAEMFALVRPEYFYLPAHHAVFRVVRELHENQKPFDLLCVTQALADSGELDRCGGAAYLTTLATCVATTAHFSHYIEIIRNKSGHRDVLSLCRRATEQIDAEPETDAGSLLASMSDEISTIRASAGGAFPSLGLSLIEVSESEPDNGQTLLGNRFLCIEGSMLFVGPSGIGKSSASIQQDILWAIGAEAFGIRPARPLRILTIQAENDMGDLSEISRGVINGLKLCDQEIEMARRNVTYISEKSHIGTDFLIRVVAPALEAFAPDILRIDPFNSYLGGDPSNAELTAAFLQNGINPLLERYRAGLVLCHHTPKVINRDTSSWRASDWMYSGAGSANITNWARAALVIDPTHDSRVFKFIAAKRGSRIGWASEEGSDGYSLQRCFSHASDGIYWRPSTAEEIESAAERKPSPAGKTKTGSGHAKTARKFDSRDVLDLISALDAKTGSEIEREAMEKCDMSRRSFYYALNHLSDIGYIIKTPKGWVRKLT